MAEWVKLITCLVLVFYEEGKNADKFVAALRKTVIENLVDTLKVCVPSLLYVIQNNLLYVSASNLDAATNQVCYLISNPFTHFINDFDYFIIIIISHTHTQ